MIRLLVVLGLASGCATPRGLSSNAMARLGNPAPTYATPPDGALTDVNQVFASAFSPSMRERMRHDPRLDVAAEVVAEHYAQTTDAPESEDLRWLFWRVGFPGRHVHTRYWRQGAPNFKKLDADLKLEALACEIPAAKHPGTLAYGVARVFATLCA